MAEAHRPPDAPLRILAIDDNPGDLELLAIALDALGVNPDLRTATDGRDAIELMQGELLREHGWRPELIVVDLSMPRIDGIEMITRLRANRALVKVPLVVLSGSIHPADRARALAAGAARYLSKPANFEGLLELLRGLLAELPELSSRAASAKR